GTALTRTSTATAFPPTSGTTWPPTTSSQFQKPAALPGIHLTVRVPSGLPNGLATAKVTTATSPGSGASVLIPNTTMPWPVMPNWTQFGVAVGLHTPGSMGPTPVITCSAGRPSPPPRPPPGSLGPPAPAPETKVSTRFARQSAPGLVQGGPG